MIGLPQAKELVAGILFVEAALGVGHGLFDGVEDFGDIRFGILVDGGAGAVAEQAQRGDDLVRPGLGEADEPLVLGFGGRRFHGCVSFAPGVSQFVEYLSSIYFPSAIHTMKLFKNIISIQFVSYRSVIGLRNSLHSMRIRFFRLFRRPNWF